MLTPQEESINCAWQELSGRQKNHLVDSLARLAKMFGSKVSDERLTFMARRLAPYALGNALYQALDTLGEGERFPSVQRIKEAMRGRSDLQPFQSAPELTEDERERSSKSAVLSMLWLHYAKGWRLESFAGHVLGKKYQGDVVKALKAATEIYDRDLVLRWMEDRARADER